MKKEKPTPNHHMGKETGYELVNGEYHIAPLYQQQFDALAAEEQGIRNMLEIVTSHAADDLTTLAERGQRIWKTLRDDIGLDITKPYVHFHGVVKLAAHKEKPPIG